jgi:hypothetical protein
MDWYYALGGDRKGPVGEQELQSLVQQGVITSQTPVWREGMADWQPYGGGTPPPMPGTAIGGVVVCAGCGRSLPGSEVILLDGSLYCAACKPLVVQRLREGETANSAAEAMRNEYLKHEASVKSIGVLYYLGGAGLMLAGIVTLFASGTDFSGIGGIIISALLFLVGAGQLWVGTGLRRLRSWARVPTGILSGLGLIGFPFGTIINAYILYLIFSKKGKTVFSDEYQAVIEQTPNIKYRTSIVVWVLLGLVLVLIAFGVVAAFLSRSR